MFTEINYSHYSKQSVMVWLSLAFQAGAINTGGYLACHRFVSHTTGFATLFGESLAEGRALTALGWLSVPVFFLFGSMISAFFVDRKKSQGERPYYFAVFFLMAVGLLLVTLVGVMGGFGHFGAPEVTRGQKLANFFLMTTLCLVSGMQNATVTTAFHSVIRTTHLTGLTTDLGIGFVRVLFGSYRHVSEKEEKRSNWMRIGIISFFVLGAFFSAQVFFRGQYWGFLLPFSISAWLFLFSARNWFIKSGSMRAHPIKAR